MESRHVEANDTNQCMKSWTVMLTVMLTMAFISGCGGNDAAAPSGIQPVQGPQPINKQGNQSTVAGFSSGVDPQQAQAERQAREAQERAALEAAITDPDDVFDMADDTANYEIAGKAPDYSPDDLATVAAVPLDNQNASTFEIEETRQPGLSGAPKASRNLPDGFAPLPEFGVSETGDYLRIVNNMDQSVMVLVPEGMFQLGSEEGPDNIQPVNDIFIDTFYIDMHEITVGQYQAFIKALRNEKKSGPLPQPFNLNEPDNYPVRGVNYGEARLYAQWVGRDLPTEAEWEKAARGPHAFDFVWGHGRALWSRERTVSQIDAVGSFKHDESYFGAFDLAGNVREWCTDNYTDDAYRSLQEAPPKVRKNWSGPRRSAPTNHRVVRGNGPDWKVWYRWPVEAGSRLEDIGFRTVLRLPAPQVAKNTAQ